MQYGKHHAGWHADVLPEAWHAWQAVGSGDHTSRVTRLEVGMAMLERRMIEVDAAMLEVFLGGDQGPLVCDAHPFGGYTGRLAEEDHALEAVRVVQVKIGRASCRERV